MEWLMLLNSVFLIVLNVWLLSVKYNIFSVLGLIVGIDWVNYIVYVESKNYDLHEFISLIDKFKVDGVNSEWIYESNLK